MALTKAELFSETKSELQSMGLRVQSEDLSRPWGGFFVISDESLQTFINLFFQGELSNKDLNDLTLSPKILLVEPGKPLSWQYHNRRSEYWKVFRGDVHVVISENDSQNTPQRLQEGDIIRLERGIRHRAIGLDDWCIIAEIWEHSDPENPSDENDIIRVEDDFGR
ncbi:MAG: phosphoheptose isomerase [Balneolaceae bacterium]|nr:MAG: phosphoheptose isomerase [Balneolaceae bacterium]